MFQDGPQDWICSGSLSHPVEPRNVGKPTKTRCFPGQPSNPKAPERVVHRFEDRTKQRRLTLTNARSHHAPAKTQSVRVTSALGFPLNGFTHCLTLFSKFFSSFPHGTCSLSVSYQYLALDGIYHPLWAAIPNNSTHWMQEYCIYFRQEQGSHLLSRLFPEDLVWNNYIRCFFRLQFGTDKSVQIHKLSSSRFSRPYWGNPC